MQSICTKYSNSIYNRKLIFVLPTVKIIPKINSGRNQITRLDGVKICFKEQQSCNFKWKIKLLMKLEKK